MRPFVQARREWCDDFVVELRLLDVPGPVIGDRLAEVETHCGATGGTPTESSGDPVAHLTRIAQDSAGEPEAGVRTVAALGAAQLLAMLVGTTAATDWARGEDLADTVVQAVLPGLFVLVVVPAWFGHRELARHLPTGVPGGTRRTLPL